ncbi:MAG: ABC transporter ATP-binding protein [Thermoguttaceae bacterium]|jgi:ABC-type cobalamin/Fe3+-siderophores transport system ATPase subunit
MSPLLEVRDLCYLSILKKVSFRVGRGEHLIIVGQNGAGKSTLLRCIDLILGDWTGEIALDGTSIREIPRKRLAQKIAFVRQSAEMIPDITVRGLVMTGRYPYRSLLAPFSRQDEEIVDRALSLTEITSLAERKLAALSGGERQRAWLAAAIVQEPEIFLLDEPTVFLDYRRQAETYRLLDRVRTETGSALLEVTHDLNRASASATTLLALADGKVVYNGTPAGMMNRELLRTIFETDLCLVTSEETGRSFVIPRNDPRS